MDLLAKASALFQANLRLGDDSGIGSHDGESHDTQELCQCINCVGIRPWEMK